MYSVFFLLKEMIFCRLLVNIEDLYEMFKSLSAKHQSVDVSYTKVTADIFKLQQSTPIVLR